MPVHLIIVEDDQTTRENITSFLASTPDFVVLGSFSNAEYALANSEFSACDVLLTDIGLPGKSGIELIQEVKLTYHRLQCIVLTVFEDDDHVFNALKAGATGYLLKGARPNKLLDAIDEVMSGGSPMTGTIARKVMNSFRQKEVLQSEQLTERENGLLQKLAQGLRYKEIADELQISVETVRTHIRNIYQKLQVQSRTEALNKLRGI
ncbi:MAG: response regulator [Flavobacteriales bacterium]